MTMTEWQVIIECKCGWRVDLELRDSLPSIDCPVCGRSFRPRPPRANDEGTK